MSPHHDDVKEAEIFVEEHGCFEGCYKRDTIAAIAGLLAARRAKDGQAPRSAFDFEIGVSAHDHRTVVNHLRELAKRIDENPTYAGAMGGGSGGWWVNCYNAEGKTEKQYHAELDAYLSAQGKEQGAKDGK